LALGEGAARPLDVRARASVTTFEKGDTRPDVDRLLVMPFEVLIEPGQQQSFDERVALGFARERRVG
jgi:hypothetical protein